MTNPSEQFLFLPSSAPGIFSSVLFSLSSDQTSGFNENPRKRQSRQIPAGSPLRLGPSNPDSVSTSRRNVNRRPAPDAPKITSPCSECGKKFWSWKALFGHMRCHPERQWRGMNPPVNFRSQQPIVPDPFWSPVLGGGPATTMDDHEAAACLLMLANGQPGQPSQIASSNRETDFANGMMQSSSHGCCENVMDSENSEASLKTQLALNSSAAKESRDVDLSLRLGP